jgi:hypothetical protein
MSQASLTVGAMYFSADIEGTFGRPVDSVRDIAIDAIYQIERTAHNVTLAANFLQERIGTQNSMQEGFAVNDTNDLTRLLLFANYLFKKSYGLGLGYTRLGGSNDLLYFQTANC